MRFGKKKWERRGEKGEEEKGKREEGRKKQDCTNLAGLVGNLSRGRPIFLRQKSLEG
jgi:hypothetical protein